MDTLILKKDSQLRIVICTGTNCGRCRGYFAGIKKLCKAAAVYESPDVLLALANLYAEMKDDRAILFCSRVKHWVWEGNMMHIVLLLQAFIMHVFKKAMKQ